MRFTLQSVFLAVAMLALACAGITYRTYWWAGAIVTLTVLICAISAIGAIATVGRQRVTCLAFALIGIAYLLIVNSRLLHGEMLLTNLPLAAMAKPFAHNWTNQQQEVALSHYAHAGAGIRDTLPAQLNNYFIIGHCVWSWIFAVLAAWFAGRMYDRREKI